MISIAYATETAAKNITVNMNAWDAILSASPVVQLTLFVLIAMSVGSWAIIFSKKKFFDRMVENNDDFSDQFLKAESLDNIADDLARFPHSSMARAFKAGYLELHRMAEAVDSKSDSEEESPPLLHGIDNIERTLQRAVDDEVIQMESRLNFLATTGSTGPFIGLFGTVWGIMGSFQQIGAMKSASLAVVAPGISEALVATAIGLAAAIPAVMAYNHFMTRLRREEIRLSNFSSDFLNVVRRNFFKDE